MKKIKFLIVGFIVISSFYFSYYENSVNIKDKKTNIKEVSNKTSHNKIIINKINLENRLYDKGSKKNNVDKNVTFLDESDFPNKDKGNVILAAHSGNTKISYFNRLNELALGDIITLIYKDIEYNYKVVKIYENIRNGYIQIIRDKDYNTVTLTTCHPLKKDKQLIIIGQLKKNV